jgi:hypothetical protein
MYSSNERAHTEVEGLKGAGKRKHRIKKVSTTEIDDFSEDKPVIENMNNLIKVQPFKPFKKVF